MKAAVLNGQIDTPGVNWGRPLVIRHTSGMFHVVSRAGHMSWECRGAQSYDPALMMLAVVAGGRMTVMSEREPGRKAVVTERELTRLADAWAERFQTPHTAKTHEIRYGSSRLYCGAQIVDTQGAGPAQVAELLVQNIIAPWDKTVRRGSWGVRVRDLLERAEGNLRTALADVT